MESHATSFIQDLAIIMLVAGLITFICHKLKQPVVLGYLISGLIIGPHTPPFSFIYNLGTIKTLAELGVIFLMFSLGLEFNFRKLKRVGISSLIAATAEILLMIWIGYELGLLFGWSYLTAIFLGALLAISSTTIVVKALGELKLKKNKFTNLVFGILIIEDIFAVAILVFLSVLAEDGAIHLNQVLLTSFKLLSFLIISLVLGILLIPRLLTYIAKFHCSEMILISVLAICFGFSLLVDKVGYTIALGAFLAGAIISESKHIMNVEAMISPLRDMFSAIFFVSVGLLLNPKVIWEYAIPIAIISVTVVVGKVLTCSLGVFLTGRDAKTSMRVGMSLAQIGEFSFIIATLGITLDVTSSFLFPIAVAVSAITTFLTPYLIRYSDQLTDKIYKIVPLPITTIFEWYTTWLQNIHLRNIDTVVKRFVRRAIIQILINMFIVLAIFIAASYALDYGNGALLERIDLPIQKTVVWSLALIASMPFLMAIYLKITSFSLLLADINLHHKVNQKYPLTARKLLSKIIPILSLLGILLFIFTLSASILPPIELLLIASSIITLLAILLYSSLIKLHRKLEKRLSDTLTEHK